MKSKNKIGIIITTFMRDELLFKSIASLKENWQDNFELIIVDQTGTNQKAEFLKDYHYFSVSYDSGLSYCRNYGVQRAKELGCEYCLIASDSFLFNESIKKINKIIALMQQENIHKCGFNLENCCCNWEGKLNLIEGKSFELDFVDLTVSVLHKTIEESVISLWNVDICRNFFIATTISMLDATYDENLKLAEHEDQAWNYKQKEYITVWTNFISAIKMTNRPDKYKDYRRINFNNGLKYLLKKYNISQWISYKNLHLSKKT